MQTKFYHVMTRATSRGYPLSRIWFWTLRSSECHHITLGSVDCRLYSCTLLGLRPVLQEQRTSPAYVRHMCLALASPVSRSDRIINLDGPTVQERPRRSLQRRYVAHIRPLVRMRPHVPHQVGRLCKGCPAACDVAHVWPPARTLSSFMSSAALQQRPAAAAVRRFAGTRCSRSQSSGWDSALFIVPTRRARYKRPNLSYLVFLYASSSTGHRLCGALLRWMTMSLKSRWWSPSRMTSQSW